MNTRNLNQLMTAAFPYKEERVECFIDGSNMHAATKALGYVVDYKLLLELIKSYSRLMRISYYTAMLSTEEHNPLKPLVDYFAYNGYNMVTKDAKTFTNDDGTKWTKGNVDVELAVDTLKAATFVDHVVLFTGDGDFRALVQALQEMRVRVTVISTIVSKPAMCADELRKQADSFIDLADLAYYIRKAKREVKNHA